MISARNAREHVGRMSKHIFNVIDQYPEKCLFKYVVHIF